MFCNKLRYSIFYLSLTFAAVWGRGNNLTIHSVQLISSNTISCSISWENSWKTDTSDAPHNHDAAYIFIKKQNLDGIWSSQVVEVNSISVLAKQAMEFKSVQHKIGFLLLPQLNTKNIETTIGIQVNERLDTFAAIKIIGIEMVYIPTDTFVIGDNKSVGRLGSVGSLLPYTITSEDLVQVRKGPNSLDAHYDSTIDNATKVFPDGDIPAAYPKGFNGFYCMKYEISQEQYVVFLNTLSYAQQIERANLPKINVPRYELFGNMPKNQNGICADLTKNPVFFYNDLNGTNEKNSHDDGQAKACNFLSWSDLAAYLDWSGLRPMTELEYEKICRGPLAFREREYAWGNDSMTDAQMVVGNGTLQETYGDTLKANCGVANRGTYTPSKDNTAMRSGFAAGPQTNRLSSGSSYFGVMEMSGNLWEQVINLSKKGINYTGSHGDGILDAKGNATNTDWDPISCEASGVKGGGWNSGIQLPYNDCAVSDRFYVYQIQNNKRNTVGGRGVLSLK